LTKYFHFPINAFTGIFTGRLAVWNGTDNLKNYGDGISMNKSQLVEALANAKNLPLKKAEEIVSIVFEDMERALINGERVEIRGFGSFKIKQYEGYQGRNPKTGEIINVTPKKLPFFKVGKELKDRVDIY
jgi:integration host factor subunit beta